MSPRPPIQCFPSQKPLPAGGAATSDLARDSWIQWGLIMNRRSTLPRFFLFLMIALLAPAVAEAHLSIIRQGPESAGALEAGDQFGFSVAVGDFNGDGYDDLATGAPDENYGTTENAGSVIINWGSEFGLTHVGAEFLLPDGGLRRHGGTDR